MWRNVDNMGNFHQHLFLALLALLLGNILEEDRDTAVGWINADVVPCLKSLITIRCFDALEDFLFQRCAILLPKLCVTRVGEYFKDILSQYLVPLQSRSLFRCTIPVRESIISIKCKKTTRNTLEYFFVFLR